MATLLAPAGSPGALQAALDAGADAVYVGLKGWSRGGARGELDWDELERAVRQARAHQAELQVALNTIPKPREREQLYDRVEQLRAVGVRTLIVNDLGILAILRRGFPELGLTASIGCGAQTAADVAFLRDAGARAVVLPGTVGPEEIGPCCQVPGVAVEVMLHMVEEFVLLGKCWMPSYVHLRPAPWPETTDGALRQTGSMKRGGVGVCYRICEQPWILERPDGRTEVQQFPSRQWSRLGDVRAYLAAGVRIFKLQGRSLPPHRLRALVEQYRVALDAAASGARSSTFPEPVLPPQWTVVGR